MDAPRRPVMRYHGGKWRLASWIISHFPDHRVYVEPFGGAASVLLRKPRSYGEVYNDRWDVVVNVFRVLRDPSKAARLQRLLELTPYSRTEFMAAAPDSDDEVENARRVIYRSFSGFGSASVNGDHLTGFRSNSNRSFTTPAHDWRNYPGQISSFVERLRGVVIENRPAIDVIRAHDSPDTLFYLDPPYVHETRNMRRGNAAYAIEMGEEDHVALADVVRSVQGRVVISGYRNDLYAELYADWGEVERPAMADGARARLEVLWLSPKPGVRNG